jgi:hypothetical protein
MTVRESIELNERNGVKHAPELKEGDAAVIAAHALRPSVD